MSVDPSEFTTTLEKQGPALCLPLGEALTAILERHGFRLGQEVLVRFGQERMQILLRGTVQEVRDELKLAGAELKRFEARMKELLDRLPAVSDEALEREESLEGELQGLLECLLADDLAPAIRKLEAADAAGRPGKSGPFT
jgi:hypothetical protein